MKGQGKIKYWFTKNGVHIPVYEKYTTRKGVEPENPKAKFKPGTKKESFNTEESIQQKTTKVQAMEDEFKPTTSMSIKNFKLEDKKWGRRQTGKYNRELDNLSSGIDWMSEQFGDISDLVGNIYLRNLESQGASGLHDPKGTWMGKGRATYFGTNAFVDEALVVHEMTHGVTEAIADQYKALGYKSRDEVFEAMRNEVYSNLGKQQHKYDGRKHHDRASEYMSLTLENYGALREAKRNYERAPEVFSKPDYDDVGAEAKEALKVLKKYYKKLGRK